MKIIIAEKKKELYDHLLPICSSESVEIVTCSNEQDLIMLARQSLPLVIVLESDYSINNQSLLNSLLEIENLREIPMLFVCRNDEEKKQIINLSSSGVFDIISKPVDINEFISRIKVFIKLALAQRRNHESLKMLDQLHTQLSKEHLKFVKILELMPVAILIYKDDLTLEFMNHDAELLTGYQFSLFKNKKIDYIYDKLQFQRNYENIIKIQGELYCRDTFINHQGRKINIERKCINITDKARNVICRVDVFRDITTALELEVLMEARIEERSQGVLATQNITMMSLASLAESRDNETGLHLERMRTYSKMIAQELLDHNVFAEVNAQFVKDIYSSSPLHDIGKVGTPDYVLLKPGKLTSEEWEIMKMHPVIGAKTLQDAINQGAHASFLAMARDICYGHHEKYDGSGYPKGLKGTEIPLSARIVALADCYDALRSARIYKNAYSHEESKQLIIEKSGIYYDPHVVDAFIRIEKHIIEIAEKFRDEEEDHTKTDISGLRR